MYYGLRHFDVFAPFNTFPPHPVKCGSNFFTMNTRKKIDKAANTAMLCLFLFVLLVLTSNAAWASCVIQSQETVDIELKGYNGLTDTTLFKGSLTSGTKQTIDTSYQGLALLIFEKGSHYPVIFGEQSFGLQITDPATLPSFTGSNENEFFYKLLTGVEPTPGQYDFALLMIQTVGCAPRTIVLSTDTQRANNKWPSLAS